MKLYDATPLQVLTDARTRSRIVRMKQVTGKSQAQVVREILAAGLDSYEIEHGVNDVD